MKRSTRLLFVVLALAIALGGALYFTRSKGSGANAVSASAPGSASSGGDRVVPVATAIVKREDVPIVLEGLGTVTPLATVTVKTQVDGRLDRVLFKEGQSVKKGEVLALVDSRSFTIQLHQAEAALARDDAQLANGKVNRERYEQLRRENLIPQQQLDDQVASVAQLEATTRSDKAQIETARLMLDYARITSPIDGVTGLRQVDQGNVIQKSDPNGIVLITQLDPIAVLFTLPQDVLPRVLEAMRREKIPVEAYARDGIQKLATGELLLVDNQVNSQTATIRLKASLPNPNGLLWPNAFVKARVRLATTKDAITMPASAVQRGPKGTFVYVVSGDKTATTRPIEVASIEGDLAIVGKGLAEGDVVVTDGQNQIRPGSRVSMRGATSEAAGSASPGGSASPAGSASAGTHRARP